MHLAISHSFTFLLVCQHSGHPIAYERDGFQFAAKDASKLCVLDRGTTCTGGEETVTGHCCRSE